VPGADDVRAGHIFSADHQEKWRELGYTHGIRGVA
jgi:hypothetical protein